MSSNQQLTKSREPRIRTPEFLRQRPVGSQSNGGGGTSFLDFISPSSSGRVLRSSQTANSSSDASNNATRNSKRNIDVKKKAVKVKPTQAKGGNKTSNMTKRLARKKGKSAAIVVPKNSKKNKVGNYGGMHAKTQYQQAILGNCGSGPLSHNDEQTLEKGGCIEWLFWAFVFANPNAWKIVMPLLFSVPPGSELVPIVKASGAEPQDEKDDKGYSVYTGIKVKRTEPIDGIENADVNPNLRIFAQSIGLSGTSQTGAENMLVNEVNRSHNASAKAKGKRKKTVLPDLHPSTTNAVRPNSNYLHLVPIGPKFWTWQACTIFFKDFKEDIMPYFYKDGRRLTDVLKGKGCYNIAYIESFEKQVTKDLVIKALLIEKYGASEYKAEHATLSAESLFD